MREPQYTTRFRKDLRRQNKRGKDLGKLETVMEAVCEHGEAPLSAAHNIPLSAHFFDFNLVFRIRQKSIVDCDFLPRFPELLDYKFSCCFRTKRSEYYAA